MAKPKSTTDEQELKVPLPLARLQVTKAERNLEAAKERSRLAKRRRKEAKEAARRAKKGVKRAKIELAEAKDILARAQLQSARVKKRPVRKRSKAVHAVADAQSHPQKAQKSVLERPGQWTRPGPQPVLPTPAPSAQSRRANPKPPIGAEVSMSTQKAASQSSGMSTAEGSTA